MTVQHKYIYHIIPTAEWKIALEAGKYIPGSLNSEGFIHFSYAHQVAETAGRYYRDIPGLVVLKVPVEKVAGDLREEGLPGGELFPHLYRELKAAEVVDILPLERLNDGTFMFTG